MVEQVFNGSAPYLSYDDSTDLPRAMHAYREASKHRTNDRVVAVFRETALPCLPETSWLSVRPTIPSRSFRDRVTGGGFSGSGEGALETCGRRLAENLAATGMAQTVHRRGLQGEAKGVTMVCTGTALLTCGSCCCSFAVMLCSVSATCS